MKIILEDTDLFAPDLKIRLQHAITEQGSPAPEKQGYYTLQLHFSEASLLDLRRMDAFEIPQESLPKYQRGVKLSGKDKLSALLSYQLNEAVGVFESYGFPLIFCGVTGIPLMDPNRLEITLNPDTLYKPKPDENGRRTKRDKPIKVMSIMPSLSGFANTLLDAYQKEQQRKEQNLLKAFDDKAGYEKYAALLGKDALYEVYTSFVKDYGDLWTLPGIYNAELKTKFLDTVKVKAGLVEDSQAKAQILQPLAFKMVLIYAIPVHKKTKTGRAAGKYVGQVKLLTNGRVVKLEYEPHHKAYEIPNNLFEECLCSVEEKDDSNKLFQKIRTIVAQADNVCETAGYTLEQETVYNVLSFTDLKSMLKNARQAKFSE